MSNYIKIRDVIALGSMTFALFVGAGNIIFPPMVGLRAGENFWIAATGFLITSVGLPVLTVVALSTVKGGIDSLSSPLGKIAGLALSIICNLAVGPLFAIPRTSIVSFEVGIIPLHMETMIPMIVYSIIYFLIVILVSLYPKKLFYIIGKFLAPLKIIALIILASSAVIWSAGSLNKPINQYQYSSFTNGFLNGYLTMDTLGAMVFGTIIISAARTRGIDDKHLTKNTILACLIAGTGLVMLYLALFCLGSKSSMLVNQYANGATILQSYVQYIFGNAGKLLLAILICLACLVTAVGLTCACAEFFSDFLLVPYNILVLLISSFSMLISNLGLNYLIKFSMPILMIIYPPCIIIVISAFIVPWCIKPRLVIIPSILISLIFGVFDGISISGFSNVLPNWIKTIPLIDQKLGWLIPSLIILIIMIIWDRLLNSFIISNIS